MDEAWVLEQAYEWFRLRERVPLSPHEKGRTKNAKTKARGTPEELERSNWIMRQARDALFGVDVRWVDADIVRDIIHELKDGVEVREKLGVAREAPRLSAGALHPWVWSPAAPHWESGNYDAALWAAAININTNLQKKLERRDLGESKLITEAFSLKPPENGKPRLRLCDDSNRALYQDRHLGALNLGQGLFSGVRNPLNHIGAPDLDEQEALETLAAWSLFARWVDEAAVEEAPECE